MPEHSQPPVDLLVVLLGSSSFPLYSKTPTLDNESYRRSAHAFRDLLRDGSVLLAEHPAFLDLFESDHLPSAIVTEIKAFIRQFPNAGHVVFYYCGHGDIFEDQSFFTILRCTDEHNEYLTALKWKEFWFSIRKELYAKKTFFILDCCYAGDAAREFQSSSIYPLIQQQVDSVMSPGKGVALIAAAGSGLLAKAPQGQLLTMFTGELVSVLKRGVPGAGRRLSFRDIMPLVQSSIGARHGAKAVFPVWSDVIQPEGHVTELPLFFNNAVLEPDRDGEALTLFELACDDLAASSVATRLGALKVIAECLDKTGSTRLKRSMLDRVDAVAAEDDSRAVIAEARQIARRFGESEKGVSPLRAAAAWVAARRIAVLSAAVAVAALLVVVVWAMYPSRPSLDAAGYRRDRLERLIEACGSGCPDGVVATATSRVATLDAEKNRFAAAGHDIERLAAYLQTCQACEFADAARKQLAEAASQALEAAGYERGRLTTVVAACAPGCPEAVQAATRSRLATLGNEKARFVAAGQDPGRLAAYLQTCEACEFKGSAEQQRAQAAADALGAAGYRRDKLAALIATCRSDCPDDVLATAQRRLATLDAEQERYAAAGRDAGRLAVYLPSCEACAFKEAARARLAEAASTALEAAGFQRDRLAALVATCSAGCPDDVLATAQRRMATLDGEKERYVGAGHDLARLAAYLRSCQACEFKEPAERHFNEAASEALAQAGDQRDRLKALIAACGPACTDVIVSTAHARMEVLDKERSRYAEAGHDLGRLTDYLQTCKACDFRDAAQRQLAEAAANALEAAGYQRDKLASLATSCVPPGCPNAILSNARARIAVLDAEKERFAKAGRDPELLKAYLQTCQACEYREAAEKSLAIDRRSSGFQLYDNRDLVSHDLDAMAAGSSRQCELSCKANAQCEAFTFDKWNDWCIIKNNVEALKINPKAMSGVMARIQPIPASKSPVEMQRFPGKSFSRSAPYQVIVESSMEDCERQCSRQSNCVSYTYIPLENQCRLFRVTAEYFTEADAKSGIKIQSR